MKNILVAGASGVLGSLVVSLLKSQGYGVHALVRSAEAWNRRGITADRVTVADITDPRSLENVCTGADAVITCAGASMDVRRIRDRSSFLQVDRDGNTNLLREAERANVQKFVAVSLAGSEELSATEYARAHYLFERNLAGSGIPYTIVQPTGFFYILGDILRMARSGRGVVIGDGSARTNPIHEQDVAQCVVEALTSAEQRIVIGGPEVFTRKEIVISAFYIAGKKPSILSVPPALFAAAIVPLKVLHPRLHALMDFGRTVSTTDVVFPAAGKRTIRDYFRQLMEVPR